MKTKEMLQRMKNREKAPLLSAKNLSLKQLEELTGKKILETKKKTCVEALF